MDQGRGLWDLLFGVSDPDANIDCSHVKMEDNPSFQMDLSEDLLALLSDPMLSMQALSNGKDSSSSSFSDLMEDISPDMVEESACAGLDLDALGELSAYLQMPDFISSSSISSSGSDEDGSSSSDNLSIQGSPKSSHSTSATDEATSKEVLVLSREEAILLKKEGLHLPKCYPLTKQEERTLKKIRRKIRNKKSAQESRRKKKVYMDQLEDQVKDITGQNKTLGKRVKELEKENVSLQQQLKTLQNVFGRATRNTKATGTCLMALVLSVALIVSPYTQNNPADGEKDMLLIGDYEVENVAPARARIMYNLDGPPDTRLFGIPLAKESFRSMKTEPVALPAIPGGAASNSVVPDHAWDARYGRIPMENVSVTLSQNPVVATH